MPPNQSSSAGKIVSVVVALAIVVVAYLIYKSQGGVAAPGAPVKVSMSAPAVSDESTTFTVTVEAGTYGGTIKLTWTWVGCDVNPFVENQPVSIPIAAAGSITQGLTVSAACTTKTVVTVTATLEITGGGTRTSTTTITLNP